MPKKKDGLDASGAILTSTSRDTNNASIVTRKSILRDLWRILESYGGNKEIYNDRTKRITGKNRKRFRMTKEKRNKKIVELIDHGMKSSWIAEHIGMSRERIRQIYKKKTGSNPSEVRQQEQNGEIKFAHEFHCNWCGEGFYRHKGEGMKYYCGYECYKNVHKRVHSLSYVKVCEWCGCRFFPWKSRMFMGNKLKRYMCSNECRLEYLLGMRKLSVLERRDNEENE